MTTAVPPDAGGVQDLERRLEEVVSVIQELAALRFGARATVGPAGDIVDAVAAGVNSLGEELEASYQEIERQVADRTAELAMATQELRRRALHDDLTGLANRAAFWDRLTHRVDGAGRRTTGFAVLFLDLDGFKTVNDTLGHAAGTACWSRRPGASPTSCERATRPRASAATSSSSCWTRSPRAGPPWRSRTASRAAFGRRTSSRRTTTPPRAASASRWPTTATAPTGSSRPPTRRCTRRSAAAEVGACSARRRADEHERCAPRPATARARMLQATPRLRP